MKRLLTPKEKASAVNLGVDKAVAWSRENPNASDIAYNAMRESCIVDSICEAQLAKADKHKSIKGEILSFKKRPDLVFPTEYYGHRQDREKIEQAVYDYVYIGLNDANLPYLTVQPEFYTTLLALFDEEEIRKQGYDEGVRDKLGLEDAQVKRIDELMGESQARLEVIRRLTARCEELMSEVKEAKREERERILRLVNSLMKYGGNEQSGNYNQALLDVEQALKPSPEGG